MRQSTKNKKLLLQYKIHHQILLRDLHFFGLQATEDYLENKLLFNQYKEFMNEIESDIQRYLLLIHKINTNIGEPLYEKI